MVRSLRFLVLLLPFLSACFTTQVQSGQPRSFAPVKSDRQWFTVGGLVQLSDAAGQECPDGVSWVESGYGTTDVLISAALTVGSAMVASAVCDLPDNATDEERASYSLCTGGIGGIVPFLIGSRTVEYQCAGGSSAPGVQVPALSPVPGQKPMRAASAAAEATPATR